MTRPPDKGRPGDGLRFLAAVLLVLVAGGCSPALREPPSLEVLAETSDIPAPDAATSLLAEARALFHRRDLAAAQEAASLSLRAALEPATRHAALVETVRILLWIVNHDDDPQRRASTATRAVDVAVWCGRTAPDDPACDYWLGAAMGIQARERRTTGLSALPQVEAAFLRAAAAAPDLESAAPDRALALLYVRAPGWPTGPGDPDLAVEHARKAVDRFPDHPANLLALAEALEAIGDREGAREAWDQAAGAAAAATRAGDPDGAEWQEDAEEALQRAAR